MTKGELSKIPAGWWWAMQVARLLLLGAMFCLAYVALHDGFQPHDLAILIIEAVLGAFVLVALGPAMGGTWGD